MEAIRAHRDVSKAQARDRAVEMLGLVGIPEPRRRAEAYPHEFSGGMRQRAMIAMALANDPKLLIADEPTTALDVTVQAQILELIERLQGEFDMAVVVITHDLGVVAEMADEIAVMYAGRVVEHAPADDDLPRARAPVHVGPAELDPAARHAARQPADPDRRAAADADHAAQRLLVPPALPVRARARTGASTRCSSRWTAIPSTASRACSTQRAPAAVERAAGREGARAGGARSGRGRRVVSGDSRGPRSQGAARRRAAGRGPRPRQALPAHARDRLPPPDRRGARRRRRVLRRAPRRDARHRRRERVRQVDDGPR